MSAEDYLYQLESAGLGDEDRAALAQLRAEDQEEAKQGEAHIPPALRHIFQRHFRQGRFLLATGSEAAAARVIRDLGFAAFVNAPAAFISLVGVREVDQMAVMQVSALTDWFAEVETPMGTVYGLHYPSAWINLPAPVEDEGEHPVQAILKKIMLNAAPLAATERHIPEAHSSMRWVTPGTQLRIDYDGAPPVTGVAAALEIANAVVEQNLRIRRISGGDLLLAETCRSLFPEFFPPS